MLQYLVQLCLMQNTENLSQCDWALLSDFPAEPCPAQKALLLECQSTVFTICPKDSCQQSHKLTFNPGSPIPIYPKHCLGHCHFGKCCKQELLCPKEIEGNFVFLPLKPLIYFDPKDLMGSLLLEPGLEAKMDAAWSKTTESKGPDIIQDIFNGKCFKTSRGMTVNTSVMRKMKGVMYFCSGLTSLTPYQTSNLGKRSLWA